MAVVDEAFVGVAVGELRILRNKKLMWQPGATLRPFPTVRDPAALRTQHNCETIADHPKAQNVARCVARDASVLIAQNLIPSQVIVGNLEQYPLSAISALAERAVAALVPR